MMVKCRNAIGGALFFATCGLAPIAMADVPAKAFRVRSSSRGVEPTPGDARPKPNAAELAAARRLFAVALAAEDEHRWPDALATYERVRQIAVSPSLWYHIAVCHEALGNFVDAVNAFDLALSSAKTRREFALAKEARSRLEALRARTAQISVHIPDDARGVRIEIDGEPLSAALAGAEVIVAPGDRRVVVRAENYAEVFDATVHAAARDRVEVRAALGSKRIPMASSPRALSAKGPADLASTPPSRAPAFAVGGIAVALAASAVATGVAAYNVRETFLRENENPAPGSLDRRQSLRETGQALAIASTALTGGAVLAGGLATYLFWPSRRVERPTSTTPTALVPWVGPEGGGLSLRGAL